MRRQFLGILFAFLTFLLGFSLAPIRFVAGAVGSNVVATRTQCSFGTFSSTWFDRLSAMSCMFDDAHAAKDFINTKSSEGKVISVKEDRTIVGYETPDKYYCSYWLDGKRLLSTCSGSLAHVIEFERQTMMRRY